jgi:hypothetical protein
MKILRVVLELGKSSMHVLAEYQGVRKNVKYTWETKIRTDVPPADWEDHVLFEMEDIYSQERLGRFSF